MCGLCTSVIFCHLKVVEIPRNFVNLLSSFPYTIDTDAPLGCLQAGFLGTTAIYGMMHYCNANNLLDCASHRHSVLCVALFDDETN